MNQGIQASSPSNNIAPRNPGTFHLGHRSRHIPLQPTQHLNSIRKLPLHIPLPLQFHIPQIPPPLHPVLPIPIPPPLRPPHNLPSNPLQHLLIPLDPFPNTIRPPRRRRSRDAFLQRGDFLQEILLFAREVEEFIPFARVKGLVLLFWFLG